jgi:hypothetical protein
MPAYTGNASYFTASNQGVSGQAMSGMITTAASVVDPAFGNNTRRLVAWGGTNDVAVNFQTGATVYGNVTTYLNARSAAGWKTVVIGMMPRGAGAGAFFETQRTTINNSFRADFPTATAFTNVFTGTTFPNAVFVDIGADATLGPAGAELNTTYFGDQIHLTNAGYAIVAAYVKNALTLLL